MIDLVKKVVENAQIGREKFWFENRDKEPKSKGDQKVFLDNVFVAVGEVFVKDKNGNICEYMDATFVPLLMDKKKTKLVDILSGEEIEIFAKNGKLTLKQSPQALKGYTKTVGSRKFLNFMEFFGQYGDYFQKAFPKTDFMKMFNLACVVKKVPDVTVGDLKILIPKVEKTYVQSQKQNLNIGKTPKTSKKNVRGFWLLKHWLLMFCVLDLW